MSRICADCGVAVTEEATEECLDCGAFLCVGCSPDHECDDEYDEFDGSYEEDYYED